MTLPRPDVVKFAVAMEDVLRDNDHKGGWENINMAYLMVRLVEEFDELKAVYREGVEKDLCDGPIDEVIEQYRRHQKEAVDVANFCMMQYCNLERRIEKLTLRKKEGQEHAE